jgi:hypothetical protein
LLLDGTGGTAVRAEEGESFVLRWSEDKMAGRRSLRKGEDGGVSVSVVDGQRPVWGSGFIAGDDARWVRQIDSDWESTDFDFLAIVLKSKQRRG